MYVVGIVRPNKADGQWPLSFLFFTFVAWYACYYSYVIKQATHCFAKRLKVIQRKMQTGCVLIGQAVAGSPICLRLEPDLSTGAGVTR